MTGLPDHVFQFKESYLSEDQSHMSVNKMWVKFKTGLLEAVEQSTVCHGSMLGSNGLWKDARNSSFVHESQMILTWRTIISSSGHTFRRESEDAYWKHVCNIFTFENVPSDPDANKSGKIKKFWSFDKSLKKDAFGIPSLRENGIRKTNTKEKLIFATGNSNLPSPVRQILTRL